MIPAPAKEPGADSATGAGRAGSHRRHGHLSRFRNEVRRLLRSLEREQPRKAVS